MEQERITLDRIEQQTAIARRDAAEPKAIVTPYVPERAVPECSLASTGKER